MPKSDAVRIAEIAERNGARRDLVTVVTDPLWSTVLGFVVVHEARKANLVGPVADDILYAGIITVNTARVAQATMKASEGSIQAALGGFGAKVDDLLKFLPMIAGGA